MEFEDEEYKQFLQDLQQYPNYFQMGTENCSSNFWKKIAQKIKDEKEEDLKCSDLVRIKNQNLEACASYNLGNVDKAEQIISKVLEDTNSSSINACAMMAILNYRKGEISKAKGHLSRIKELAVDPYHIDVAKSELAYAYTRLNPRFYKKAIALYTEAVERNPNNIPWKFGLAVIYRRCMNPSIQAIFPDLQINTCFNEAEKYLTYVLENCSDKKDLFFKVSSYIELADLYTMANTSEKLTKTDKKKIIDLVNHGVHCLPKNTTILMKAGRILRHCSQFVEAVELLKEAYKICPNSYICHQLGLTQKSNIIHEYNKSHRFPKRNQSSWRDHSYPSTSTQQPDPVQRRPVDSPWQISKGKKKSKKKKDSKNKPVMNMTRLINSPKKETYDLELSRKLDPCLDLFRESAELGQEQNLDVYYDWGITLLQMIPTKFDEVTEKFNHILEKDRSQFLRYRCYEQYGICKLRMSELQDLDEILREDYRQNAKEMFRNAIRCWAYCQKINLSKHFDDAEGNCNSLISIRQIISEEDPGHGTEQRIKMASLNHLMSLYPEVYDELQHTSDTAMDSDVIQGIIRNHLQLQRYTNVLDLLALLLCSKEGLQCLEFKTDVLTHIMHYSIDKPDYQLSKSVFNFEKNLNEEIDNDVVIIFNEKDQVSKTKGATLQKWLCTFSKSGLKVIKITETAANLPQHQEQIKLICNSKMAIFILANETPSTELIYFMNTALKAHLDNNNFLKIFPIVINDGMIPDIFKIFRSMKITHQPNILEEQDKSEFLKTFSDIFLE